MPELKTYGVFISHAWAYDTDYYRLVDMLNNAHLTIMDTHGYFAWRNYSVPVHDPLHTKTRTDSELEQELRHQIRPVNIVVILSGMYVAYSKWIQKEIDIALEMSKPVIGIRPRGSEKLPVAVQNAASDIVGWNTSSIVGAIRRWAL